MHDEHANGDARAIQLPRPTAWPLVLALGIALIVTGLVTNAVIAILGLVLALAGSVGWFFQVFPQEAHEAVPVSAEEVRIGSVRTIVQRGPAHPGSEAPRKILPIETFRITTGIRGGIAGGTAMVVPATIFSVLKYHSLWYAVNLLAAGGFLSWAGASDAFLSQFHPQGVLAGFLIQGFVSLLVGLLYGAMLPMFPRYPILTAGFMVPLLFTGLVHSALGIVSPILNQRIDWFWFVVSQIAFGLVCGYVVNLQAKVRTPQVRALPFAVRAGLHIAPEELAERPVKPADEEDKPR
jgi:hypothetical protein